MVTNSVMVSARWRALASFSFEASAALVEAMAFCSFAWAATLAAASDSAARVALVFSLSAQTMPMLVPITPSTNAPATMPPAITRARFRFTNLRRR